MNERELIAAVREKNEIAYEQLLSRYTPLLQSLVSRFDAEDISREELMQEARISLYRAACTFRLEQTSVTFGLYAKICIWRALAALSKRLHQKPTEDALPRELPSADDPLTVFLCEEERQGIARLLEERLSFLEKEVFARYLAGDKTSAIAKELGVTAKAADNAVYRAVRKLRTFYHVYMPQ